MADAISEPLGKGRRGRAQASSGAFEQLSTVLGYLMGGSADYGHAQHLIEKIPHLLDLAIQRPRSFEPLLCSLMSSNRHDEYLWILARTPASFSNLKACDDDGYTQVVKQAVGAGLQWTDPLTRKFGVDVFQRPIQRGLLRTMMACAIYAGRADVIHHMIELDPDLLTRNAMSDLTPLDTSRKMISHWAEKWPLRVGGWRQAESLLLSLEAKAAASDALSMDLRHAGNTP